MDYDVFISYAKEDERTASAFRERLETGGFRVFFAPQSLRESRTDLQSCLLGELRTSRNVLLLWSRFVDQSQWVALETSIYATSRLIGEAPDGGAIVQQFVEPATGEALATPAAAGCLLFVAWPMLHLFPKIFPDLVFFWLTISSLGAFLAVAAAHGYGLRSGVRQSGK
jgi:TIR domain